MDETVKELSSIDGAFIHSWRRCPHLGGFAASRSRLQPRAAGWLGVDTRQLRAITQAVDCLCIVVSGSTGQVTLFRRGKMLPLIEKALVRNS